jgi:hypothetical protein
MLVGIVLRVATKVAAETNYLPGLKYAYVQTKFEAKGMHAYTSKRTELFQSCFCGIGIVNRGAP